LLGVLYLNGSGCIVARDAFVFPIRTEFLGQLLQRSCLAYCVYLGLGLEDRLWWLGSLCTSPHMYLNSGFVSRSGVGCLSTFFFVMEENSRRTDALPEELFSASETCNYH
jgi:hypothetical protein